jgi:AcrR family transcriptional regulator
MAKRPRPIRERLIDAALDLAGERPWRTVTLGDIAAAARTDLATLYQHFPSGTAIVAAVMDRTNSAMLGAVDAAASEEPPHDRLLDALMCRLDALRPHKAAVRSMLRDLPADPLAVLCIAPAFLNAMAWTLEAAGIGTAGIAGRVRVKGLAAIYLGALRVWFGDDSADQGKTMAFVDRRLRRAERLAALLPGGIVARAPRGGSAAPAE